MRLWRWRLRRHTSRWRSSVKGHSDRLLCGTYCLFRNCEYHCSQLSGFSLAAPVAVVASTASHTGVGASSFGTDRTAFGSDHLYQSGVGNLPVWPSGNTD